MYQSRLKRAGMFVFDPDEVEEAVQGAAGQSFLSKSSEQELMQ